MFEASNTFTKEKQEKKKNSGIKSILMLVFKLVSEMKAMTYRLLTIIYNSEVKAMTYDLLAIIYNF